MGHPTEKPDGLKEVKTAECMLRDSRVHGPERNNANQQVDDDHDRDARKGTRGKKPR